jgi:DNA-binding transcriptional regulator GbsR (MarR family)
MKWEREIKELKALHKDASKTMQQWSDKNNELRKTIREYEEIIEDLTIETGKLTTFIITKGLWDEYSEVQER